MAKRSTTLVALLVLACLSVLMGSAFASAPSARASHILVKTETEADDLFTKLNSATDLKAQFAEFAKEFSSCPSGRNGGDLGKFGRGAMVGPFDKVVFEKRMGVVHKVETQVRLFPCSRVLWTAWWLMMCMA
jgi:peptidyl-prolyl cis-trans isomerase C